MTTMTVSTKTKSAAASWKRLLTEAETLRGKSGLAAHRRARILCTLYDDADFLAERCGNDRDAMIEVLDELTEDLALSFAELRAMLVHFPHNKDWADGRLTTLYRRTLAAAKEARQEAADECPRPSRRRVTIAEYDRLAGEKQDVEARLRYTDERLQEAAQRIEKLASEVDKLTIENAELRGRIAELQALITRMSGSPNSSKG